MQVVTSQENYLKKVQPQIGKYYHTNNISIYHKANLRNTNISYIIVLVIICQYI